jgi:hypothetical protein
MVTKEEEAALADAIKKATKAKKVPVKIPPQEADQFRRTPLWWDNPFPAKDFVVLSDHYVYCDEHCSVHEAVADVHGEGNEQCRPTHWRSVFVATDDPDEEF